MIFENLEMILPLTNVDENDISWQIPHTARNINQQTILKGSSLARIALELLYHPRTVSENYLLFKDS